MQCVDELNETPVRIIKTSQNELEITDAIQWLIENGYEVGWTKVEGWWKDTGKPDGIFEANRFILIAR